LQTAADDEIFDRARQEQRVLVSADTDFGTLLAMRQESSPSVVLFRHGTQRRPERQAEILLSNFAAIENDLAAGSIVVIEPARLRIRALPLIS
jgi:predicted nuclease of predicted toxin-antitoxin system